MATKYDYFELIYKNKSIVSPKEIARKFPKKGYSSIYKQLLELEKEKLIEKKNNGFQAVVSEKTELLFQLIEHCLKNQINYNSILDEQFAKFVKASMEKKEVNTYNSGLNSRTLRKYIYILKNSELALIISEKPLRVKIFYNPLLNNLLLFYGLKKINLDLTKIDYTKEIEKELGIYKNLRNKNETRYRQIVGNIQINFIYHSLSMEGNPTTLLDTKKILKEEILPSDLLSKYSDEIRNYRNALKKMILDAESGKQLSVPLILEYHKLSMQHMPEIAGKIRSTNVYISGNPDFMVSLPENIRSDLDSLLSKYLLFIQGRNLSFTKLMDFSVSFHNAFQHIHPFEDGNSRTTRLLAFYIFQQKNIPIFDIPYGLLDEYLVSTKGSKTRNDDKLREVLQKTILYNLRTINELLR